jgi:hypothetical protein
VEKRICRGFTALSLIISLVVIAFIAFFAVILLKDPQGEGGEGAESPIQRARNVQCLAQIEKIEMEVQLYGVQHGHYPARLDMLGGLEQTDLYCPVTRTRYEYDPQSGKLSCPDHIR